MTFKRFATKPAHLEEAYRELQDAKVVGFDTETQGLDPHQHKVHSVQLGTPDYAILVPRASDADRGPGIGVLSELLVTPDILKVAHNFTFDYKMAYHNLGIKVVRMYDTMIAEKVLTAGLYDPANLKEVLWRYLGIEMDKEIRTTFYDGTWDGFTWFPELIDYALDDIVHLPRIMEMQIAKLKSEGLIPTAQLEMSLIPTWAMMEWRGITYNREGGQQFSEDMAREAARTEVELQHLLDPYWRKAWESDYRHNLDVWNQWEAEWQRVKAATSKRTPPDVLELNKRLRAETQALKPFRQRPEPQDTINVGSPTQLLPALRQTGLVLENTKKETLEELAGANEVIDLLLEHRGYAKLSAAFGQPLLDSISPVTGRVHPSFNPIVSTGRCSCSQPNLQQIPQRTSNGRRLRKLFTAAARKKLVVADFAGIELVIIAVLAGDQSLLRAINTPGMDIHLDTMALMLKSFGARVRYEQLKAVKDGDDSDLGLSYAYTAEARDHFEQRVSIPQLNAHPRTSEGMRAWLSDLRGYVKTITYGLAYGLSKWGLSRRLHFTLDAAELLIEAFFLARPAIKPALTEWGEMAYELGYSVTPSGRRRYYRRPRPVTPARIDERARELQGNEPSDTPLLTWAMAKFQARRELEKEYNSRVASIKRQGANAKIQGASADMTKRAMRYFEEEAHSKDWPEYGQRPLRDDEGLLLPVHDELVVEADEDVAEFAALTLKHAMERAAREILGDGVLIDVEPVITDYWTH